MSKQGIVDTSITFKILQYQIFPINPQGLHWFAAKIPRFGEKLIKKIASGYCKLSKQGIITTINRALKSFKTVGLHTKHVVSAELQRSKVEGLSMERNPLKMKLYELQ